MHSVLYPRDKATGLRDGWITSRRYMGAARLHWQVLKLHVCACCCPAAAAVSQTAYKR
jgi:hypothetical protein